MADPTLAVLLRNGSHSAANIRYALKANDVAIAYARTPIQIPIAQQSPEIIDLGFYRPSITVTGIVDTTGGDSTNTTSGFAGMESFVYTRASVSAAAIWNDGGSNSAQTYYIPYKNALEEAISNWIFQEGDTALQIEIGDATTPDYAGSGTTASTGGGIYKVAIQQFQFALAPGMEDRYTYSIQCVAKFRDDVAFA